MGDVLSYDPDRLASLLTRAHAVSTHLASYRSTDPAAADAVSASNAVLGHIKDGWVPSLQAILGCEALLSWLGVPVAMPPGDWFDDLRGLHGAALGDALAAKAQALGYDYDEMAQALEAAMADRSAMAEFVTTLGADRMVGLASRLVTGYHARGDELAQAMQDALVVGSRSISPAFGGDLVQAAATARQRSFDGNTSGAALSYLFAGGQLPPDMLVSALDALRRVETEFAADHGGLPAKGDGAVLWIQPWVPMSTEVIDDLRGDQVGYDMTTVFDPVYALLRQLAGDGATGRRVFTDPDTAAYFFAQRPVTADGGLVLTTAAAAAAATDGAEPDADDYTVHDATWVASAFVNLAGPAHADEMLDQRHVETSLAVAAILGRHLMSVELAGTDPTVGVVSTTHTVFGENGPRTQAQFDHAALDAMLDVAVDEPEGVVSLRAALTTYQTDRATVGAQRIAAGDTNGQEADEFLQEAITDAARLEGTFVIHVGHRAERHGRERDEELSFWLHGLGAAVQLGTSVMGSGIPAKVVGRSAEPLEEILRDRFAHNEADAAAAATVIAADTSERLLYIWDRALFNADVITPDLPPLLLVDGQLPAYDDLQARIDEVRAHDPDPGHATYDRSALLREMDDATGTSHVNVDRGAVDDAMKVAQLPIYQELD